MVMDDLGFALSLRPTQREHVEAGGTVEKMVLLQIVQGETCQAALLGLIHRGCGTFGVFAARRTHFHEDDASTVESDEIEFAVGASVIAG
jgi:hypothetical protein